MADKKPRILRIGVGANSPFQLGSIQLSGDGAIKFLGRDGSDVAVSRVSSGLAYERIKRPKVTAEVFDHSESAGTVTAALAEFRRILAVDTNSRTIRDERVYGSAVAELRDFCIQNARWSCRFEPLWGWEFRGPKEDPEKIGWRDALLRCEEQRWLAEPKILLVVDSHLGELRSIARRATPVMGDYFLPQNVWLAYASSDVARDSPINGLIAVCDRIARRMLDVAARAPASEGDIVIVEGQPFRSCRCWDLRKDKRG
jgi:hypothetical protein